MPAPPETGTTTGCALDRGNVTIEAAPSDFSIPRDGSDIVMLEHYYTRPATLDRIRTCWLGEQIEAHVGRLSALGHTPKGVFFRVPLLRQFAGFSSRNGVEILADRPPRSSPFTAKRPARSHSATTRSAERLRQCESETRRPIDQFLGQLLPDFLLEKRSPKCTREPLSGFVTTLAGKHGPSPMTQICSSIRVLLRFALREGMLSRDLVPALGTPQNYRLASSLPSPCLSSSCRHLTATTHRQQRVQRVPLD